MKGEDLIKSMNGIDEKYIEEVGGMRMNDVTPRKTSRHGLSVAIIALAVMLFGSGFIYYMGFAGKVKIIEGETVGSIDDYIYKVTFEREKMLVDSSELNGSIIEELENQVPDYVRQNDKDSSDSSTLSVYSIHFDTADELYDFIGYDKLKRIQIDAEGDGARLNAVRNEDGTLARLNFSIHYKLTGTKGNIFPQIRASIITKDYKDTDQNEIGITFTYKDGKKSGLSYSEERRVENGREFIIIKMKRPDGGWTEKTVHWVEDKVIYQFHLLYFVIDNNEAETEAEVDEIITEWMKSF
jgi:hypothetical protein